MGFDIEAFTPAKAESQTGKMNIASATSQ